MNVTRLNIALILRDGAPHPQILMLPGNNLPKVHGLKHFWQDTEVANAAMRRNFGIDVVMMRTLHTLFVWLDDDQQNGQSINVYALRLRKNNMPTNARWVAVEDLPPLSDLPFSKDDVLRWLNTPIVPAWYRFGWYDSFVQTCATAEIEIDAQIRAWERSCIWRMRQHNATLYAKFVPPVFKHEVALSQWMNTRYPENSPHYVTHPFDNALLSRDYGTNTLASIKDEDVWAIALKRFAEIQVDIVDHIDELQAMSVPLRGWEWITTHLEHFFADESNLRYGEKPLQDDEVEQLYAQLPIIRNHVRFLAAQDIPLSLTHGDLWPAQVIVQDKRPLFADWSDSAIAHPFFDFAHVYNDLMLHMPVTNSLDHKIEAAYLAPWQAHLKLDHIHEILNRTRPIAGLYMALRHHYDILPHMGQAWELHNMVAFYLRLMMAAL